MFEPAKDKGGDADEDAQHRPAGLVDLHADEDEDAAEDAVHQKGGKILGEPGLTQRLHRPGGFAGKAGQKAAHRIPGQRKQRLQAFGTALHREIPDPSGVEIEPEQRDGDEPHREEDRPDHTVFTAQKRIPADGDHHAGKRAAYCTG